MFSEIQQALKLNDYLLKPVDLLGRLKIKPSAFGRFVNIFIHAEVLRLKAEVLNRSVGKSTVERG
ncbi:MAG: hypothetical protein GY866_28015 [Proteobacteria bacterium]|nr:hypothetical protein [Pseudomonadota bacterium]